MNSSINGQHSWYVDTGVGFEEEIKNIGSGACRGNGVWLINNNVSSGAYANMPASPTFTQSYGESTVRTGSGDSVSASFFFKTLASTADGSSFTFSFSPAAQGRVTYLRFENNLDANGGLQLVAYVGNFVSVNVAQNISRGAWHHVKITMTAPDGFSNDVVNIYLDGTLVNTDTSLEDFYSPGPVSDVSRVMFRLAFAPSDVDATFTTSAGFYIDDYIQKAYNASAPSVILESYSTGFEP